MRPTILALISFGCVLPAFAVETSLVQAGYTGLGVTPNARLLAWGKTEVNYENQLAGVFNRPAGHNYVFGFGLLPNLELAGRIAANELNSDCFSLAGCGTRDLSGSFKFGTPLGRDGKWSAAAGVTDIGGSVTYFRSYYGVLTYDAGDLEFSGGLAKRSGPGSARGSKSPLNGPFMSAAWQPVSVLRAHVEHADGVTWAGARVYAPEQWLPAGWSASVGLNRALTSTNLTREQWWTASLSIPLYKTSSARTSAPTLPVASAAANASPALTSDAVQPLPAVPAPSSQTSVPPAPPTAPLAPDAQDRLAQALVDKGLADIWIGSLPGGAIAIRADNATYAHNAVDALGAALGAIGKTLGDSQTSYRLILTQQQAPLVAVSGRADCLREWIARATASCTAGQLSTPASSDIDPLHAGADWRVRGMRPSWSMVRVSLSPALRTTVATDVGVLDYSLAAQLAARLPLWRGGSAEWAVNAAVLNSSDFESGRIYGNQRIRPGTERLTVSHTQLLPLKGLLGQDVAPVLAQVSAGRASAYLDGALFNLRWEPSEGRHRLAWTGGVLQNNTYQSGNGPLGALKTAKPALGSYRYSFMPTRTDLEVAAGRFQNNDAGMQFGMRQWFSDVSVGLYYKRTAFNNQPHRQFVGIELTMPIGPRQDWQLSEHLQFGGASRFAHRVETTIRETGVNAVRFGQGVKPTVPEFDLATNSDRTGLAYFEDNLPRLRQAAQR